MLQHDSLATNIKFTNLTYQVKSIIRKQACKTLLKNLNGHFRGGELIAIMGPSGAGKTTLLNVLAGISGKINRGEILINGVPIDIKQFRKQSCYIMQESGLLEQLTVMETMFSAACLKLQYDRNNEDKANIIYNIMESLSLNECKDVKAINLSGGQKKRLLIAQELICNPPVMFVDEPTSGLDIVSSNYCINILKQLSKEGKLVVCTIHQPSARILELFDHLYLLSSGQCFYKGSVLQLVPYLQTYGLNCPKYHNPADFAMEVACGEHGTNILENLIKQADTFETHYPIVINQSSIIEPLHQNIQQEGRNCYKLEEKLFKIKNSWNQFIVLLNRSARCMSRDLISTHLRITASIIVAICTGSIYFGMGKYADDIIWNSLFLAICTMYIVFCAMMPTILTFPLEKVVFMREYINSWYSIKLYYIAKTLIEVPVTVVSTVLFLAIVYFMTGQPFNMINLILFLLIGILTALNAQSIGLLVGILFGIKNGSVAGAVFTMPLVMLSGILLPLKYIPNHYYWLSYLNYVRYAWEASFAVMYRNREIIPCRNEEDYCHFKNINKFLNNVIGIEKQNIVISIFALFILLVIKRIFIYFVLKYKARRYR